MRKQYLGLLAIGLILVQSIACSTHRAHINYDEFKKDMPMKVSSWDGAENLGHVTGEDGGAIWANCTENAKGSILELIAEAKAKGGNALGDIKWNASGTSEPTCKKGWGYLIIWPFILTPLFMSTRVDGTAYKVKSLKTGMHFLPTTPEEEAALVEKLLTAKSE